MRAGAWLRAMEAAAPIVGDVAALLGPYGDALVLAPHPDDESLGCGGLIAACVAAGRRVRVAVVSDGQGSHPTMPAAELVALRQRETRAAVTALGLDPDRDLLFVGLPDGAVPSEGPAFDAALEWLRGGLPPAAAVFVTWRHDPHCDHAASFALGAALAVGWGARLFEYAVWGWAFAQAIPGFRLPAEPEVSEAAIGVRLDIAGQLPAKRAAVLAHGSQTGGLADGFHLPAEALALAFRPHELFLG